MRYMCMRNKIRNENLQFTLDKLNISKNMNGNKVFIEELKRILPENLWL